jgi:ATP-dependent RNA helicase DeaD
MIVRLIKILRSFVAVITGKNGNKPIPQKVEQEGNKAGGTATRKVEKSPAKFRDIGLPEAVLSAIEKMGYEEMTPVQEATYSYIMAGQDLCALAETGSGKTAACAIPLVQCIDTKENAIQGLVIVPTRELCIQYVDEIEKIGREMGVIPFAVFGGFDKKIQVAKIKHEVHILVATPGRLIDLLYDGAVNLSKVTCVVLDEADELLREGFLEDIEFIMSCILQEHQTLLFAATMDEEIKKLTHNYLRNPVHLSLIKKRAAPATIEHYFAYVYPNRKKEELIKYLAQEDVGQGIIFCNARYKVDNLFRDMRKELQNIDYIHAGLSQDKRSSLFRQFKKKKLRYLIATDVAGRGLDFTHITHVVNWDLPDNGVQYTHRTGRSGRMGRSGRAFTLVTKGDLPRLRELIRKRKVSPRWIGRDPFKKDAELRKGTKKRGKRHYQPSHAKKVRKEAVKNTL